jgi:hypothetical protein
MEQGFTADMVASYGAWGTRYGGSGLWIWDFGIQAWGFGDVDMGERSPGMGKVAEMT